MPPRLTLLGVPVVVRPTVLVTGALAALVVALAARERRATLGVVAGALWYTVDCTHVVGHIISSRAAGAPMDGVDFGVFPRSVYHDDNVSPQQHIGRACGGPLASLAAALLLAALRHGIASPPARRLLTIAAAQHGLLFVLCLFPIRLVDGGVIYTNLLKLMRGAAN